MMKDKNYNLISVLYHSLQGCETCDIYRKDAEREGDQELVKFFDEVKEQYDQLANRSKALLSRRLE